MCTHQNKHWTCCLACHNLCGKSLIWTDFSMETQEQCSRWQQLCPRYLSYSSGKASSCLTSHSKIAGGSLCWLEFAGSSVMLGACMYGNHFSLHLFFYIFIHKLFEYRPLNLPAQRNFPFTIHSLFPICFLFHTPSFQIYSHQDGLCGPYIRITGSIN